MSIEFKDINAVDANVSIGIGFLASDLLQAQGMPTSEAVTTGQIAGEYAAQILFKALREMGCMPDEAYDSGQLIEIASQFVRDTINK